jgi:hypothetical protein
MIFNSKKIFLLLTLIFFSLVGWQVIAAAGSGQDSAITGLEKTMTAVGNEKVNTALAEGGSGAPSVSRAIGKIIGGALSLLGSLFFIGIVFGGFEWMTSGGDETKITRAKAIINASVWGFIIVMIAYVVTASRADVIIPYIWGK